MLWISKGKKLEPVALGNLDTASLDALGHVDTCFVADVGEIRLAELVDDFDGRVFRQRAL